MVATRTRLLSGVPSALSYILAAVFLFSAVSKLFSHAQFDQFVSAVPIISHLKPSVLLFLVVALELVIAALLSSRARAHIGAAASFCSLLVFTIVLMYSSHSSPGIPCGCFGGVFGDEDTDMSIFRNLLLLSISCTMLFSGAIQPKSTLK